ncbi:hypothetical protein LI291_09790 [Intestinibacillus massiliensis]|nr:hypothetical protein [Intestinibacillus massiliensis]
MGNRLGKGMLNNLDTLYLNISEVPAGWQKEALILLKHGVIKGDGKNQIAIKRRDLLTAILTRRIEKIQNGRRP